MTSLPRVSVVILNWNGQGFLKQFLPSVCASNYPNLEIIVGDNASSDNSVSFLKKNYQQADQEGYFLGAKLVRGAYMEKERKRAEEQNYPSPIQPDKASTDRDYDLALAFCVEHLHKIGFVAGTHNEDSCRKLTELMAENGVVENHQNIFFSQLLGMSDNLSFNLAHEGFNVAKYVPYGPVKAVLPYLFRRANENTAIAGQMGRELKLIVSEIKRRKMKFV